jgi:TRAP-type C4-dicarboxylate transport system permease small subunit
MEVYQRIMKILEFLPEIIASLACVCLVGLAILVSVNTIFRTLFTYSFEFSNEISGFSLLGVVFLGLSYALKKGIHIRVDYIINRLPERSQTFLMTMVYAVGLIFVSIFFAGTIDFVITAYKSGLRESTEFATPYYLPAILMPVGLFVLILRMIVEGHRWLVRFLKILHSRSNT